MKPSEELKDVTLRIYEALAARDTEALINMYSRQDGVLLIGTDPDEWWVGHETLQRLFEAGAQAEGGGEILLPGEVSAFVEGAAGWAADPGARIQTPSGKIIPVRITTVFQQEGGEWKVVQQHISIAIPNDEAYQREYQQK